MSGDRYKIEDQQGIYFCTFTIVHWVDVFTRQEYRDIVVDSLNYCIEKKGLEVYSWVIMSNHIHLVAKTNSPYQFSDFLRDFKKFTSKAIVESIKTIPESRREWLLNKFDFEATKAGRKEGFKVWKDGNHAIEIDSRIDIWEKINYIHENPLKAGLVDDVSAYVYSSARDYIENSGLVRVKVIE